jgi:hypothetical protein
MNTNKKTARMAGFLYFIYMAFHILAGAIGRNRLFVFGDAAATAQNIMASEWQFPVSIMIDLLGAVLFLLTAWALYVLLKPVNKNIALLFLLLNVGGAAVYSINLVNQFAALLLLSGADYLKVFQTDQPQALAMLFLYIYKNGFMIAQIFFGAWLFPLGYLVFKSGFLPRILGVALMIHCFTWLSSIFQFFLFPDFGAITYVSWPLGFIAEFGLTLWLLIMGAREQKPTLADGQK